MLGIAGCQAMGVTFVMAGEGGGLLLGGDGAGRKNGAAEWAVDA